MLNNNFNIKSVNNNLLILNKEIYSIETDFYKKALLKRIELNINATTKLIESNFLLDACALIRISVDHSCRLFQYTDNPESITAGRNKDAFKILGQGPGTSYTFKALGDRENLGILYSVLCAFVHPDLLSLILSESEDEKNDILYKVFIALGSITTTYILLEIYPQYKNQTEKTIIEEAEMIMQVFMTAIIENVTPENILEMKNIPFINNLFAKQEINGNILEFINAVEEGYEKTVEELIKQIFS